MKVVSSYSPCKDDSPDFGPLFLLLQELFLVLLDHLLAHGILSLGAHGTDDRTGPGVQIRSEASVQRPSDEDAIPLVGDAEGDEIEHRGAATGHKKLLREDFLKRMEVVVEETSEGGAKGTGAKGSIAVGEVFGSDIDLSSFRHRGQGTAILSDCETIQTS